MKKYDVAAYVWPSYTPDEPRTRPFWPDGMGEWQSVRSAQAKFPGHSWPRRPLWGYPNEADPYVMEGQIQCALDHGVNVFIYDWYWYDRRPFLETCLNDGFLKAKSSSQMKFYLMWANHSVNNTWDKRISDDDRNMIWDGAVDEVEFVRLTDRIIGRYFTRPNYYTINGMPVFMIYDPANLIRGLGGVEKTRRALDGFRQRASAAGFPGLHLQLTLYDSQQALNLTGVDGEALCMDPFSLMHLLGMDSCSHYQFVHFTDVDRDYLDILQDVKAEYQRLSGLEKPYFPHVSVGWDNNPRFWGFRPGIVRNNTPERFEHALRLAKDYADAHPQQPPLITINSWNEWTETSYLQPDDRYGYGYLEAVRRVFLP